MPDPTKRQERLQQEEQRIKRVLAALDRKPDAVIDVGVRRGTPWLYDSFEGTRFILVDPQDGGEDLLTTRPRDFLFVNKALGRAAGRMVLNEQGAMSTFLERTPLTSVATRRRYEVDVTTLDDLISEHVPSGKVGLKIDTEGYEIEVLAGLNQHVGRIDFIISEASVLNRFENSYNFSELVSEMWKKGFRFYNLLDVARNPAPRVYDCIFFQKDDPAFR